MFKKVLLTQFAIPTLNTLEYKSNTHLAPGYLVGYAKDKFPETKFIITPRIYTDLLSELDFIKYAVLQKPDLLIFSLYLWNIDKSLRVVKLLKKLLPKVKVLFGGPEVNPDNQYLLSSDQFYEGIVGEGEVAFCDYLAEKDRTQIAGLLTKNSFNNFTSLRSNYRSNTNPYLANIIETKPDKTMFFETVRGCPFNCNFCYYNKVYDKVIPVGHEHLDSIFEYARTHDFDELFILDPTFNVQPNFDELLDRMIELNTDSRFEISTELRADFLTDSQIDKLTQLNLVEAEIGLQTTNSKALKAMGRKNRTKQTIERTQKMIESGISCKVDLIAGLPEDDFESFKKSIDDVLKADIHKAIQVFRLSILSGTEFSIQKDKFKLETETTPPYYLKSTPTFSENEIREALDYAEDVFDVSLYPISPYLLSTNFNNINKNRFVEFDSGIKPIHKIVFKNSAFTPELFQNQHIKLCETLVVHFVISDPNSQEKQIIMMLEWLEKNYPHNNYQFIVEFQCEVDIKLTQNIAAAIPKAESSYLKRDTVANLGVDLNLTACLAVIVPDKFQLSENYTVLKDKCDIFLNITEFNSQILVESYEDNNFYFSDNSQQEAFKFLNSKQLLDDFTLFENYELELRKDCNEKFRIYRPNVLNI